MNSTEDDAKNLYISPQERLDLKRLLNTNNCDDNTSHIRQVKHSSRIQKNIMALVDFQKKNAKLYETSFEMFEMEAQTVASFLYLNYTDIFKRVIRNEIDYTILAKVLYVLKAVEDEKVDQHEGSILVGKVLKELYLDSAIRRGNNLDKQYEAESAATAAATSPPPPEKTISWKEFRDQKKNNM